MERERERINKEQKKIIVHFYMHYKKNGTRLVFTLVGIFKRRYDFAIECTVYIRHPCTYIYEILSPVYIFCECNLTVIRIELIFSSKIVLYVSSISVIIIIMQPHSGLYLNNCKCMNTGFYITII